MENKIGKILHNICLVGDEYGITEIERLKTKLVISGKFKNRKELKEIKKIEKLSHKTNFVALSDNVCIKLINSVELWKIIVKVLVK